MAQEKVSKKSGRRRSTLGLMEQAGSAPHVSGRFEESADIIEYGHMAEWRIAGDDWWKPDTAPYEHGNFSPSKALFGFVISAC